MFVVVVVVVFTLKAVPVSTQYFLKSVLVQLTRTPSVVGYTYQKIKIFENQRGVHDSQVIR